MKWRKQGFAVIVLSAFCLAGCGTKQADMSEAQAVTDEMDVKVLVEDYELQIPCDWMIKSVYSYQKADQPVLQIDVLDFDEEQLKQEYGYQSKEECLVHFMPNGVYEQERKEVEAAGHLKGWQLKCTADRYSEEEGAFVVSDEPVYLDFLVDDEKEKLYLFYFMNDMAEESEITSFLQNMKENGEQESEDGMYRWMIED